MLLLIVMIKIWTCVCRFIFFFKQKSAYEIRLILVGSEMCIRDSPRTTCCRFIRHALLWC